MGKNTIRLDGNLNSINGVKCGFGLITPFEGYENLGASLSHSGDLSNFKTVGDLTLNRQTGKFELSMDTTKDLSASLSLSPPVKGYGDVTATVKHTGNLENFNTVVQYAIDKRSIEGQISFRSSPVTGNAMIRSTFPSIDNYDITFRHEGTLGKFTTSGLLNLGSKRSTADLFFDSTQGYEAKLNVDTPYFKKTDIQMKHTSYDNAVSTTVYVAQDDVKLYSVQSDLSAKPLSAFISVKTPIRGVESTELSVHHEGSLSNFRSDATLQMFGGKYEIDVSFSGLPNVAVTLAIKSPLSNDIEATISHSGQPSNFNFKFKCEYGKVEQLRVETSLNVEGPYQGDLKVISPWIKNMKASFSHFREGHDFSSEAEVIYAGQKTEGVIQFKTQPNIESSVKISSPAMKDINIKFSHAGPLTNCRTNGAISYGGQPQLTVNGMFSYAKSLDSEFQVTSTMPGISHLSAKFRHDGDLSGFNCHGELIVEDRSATVDIKYSPEEGSFILSTPFMNNIAGSYTLRPTSGNIRLTSPFMNDLTGYYRIKDNILNSESKAEVSYGKTKILTASGNMNYPRSGDVSLQTPLSGFENTRLTWTRRGNYGGDAAIYVGGKKHEGTLIFNNGNKISASASISSPLLPKMSSNIDFSGNLNNFRSQANIVYDNEKYSVESELSTQDAIKGSLKIISPLMQDVVVTFNTNTDLTQLDSSTSVVYGATKLVDIRTTTESTLRKSATLSVTISNNTFFFACSFEGGLTDFTIHGEASINDINTESDITFSLTPLKTDVTLKTPSKNMQFTLSYDGSIRNFNAKSSLRIDDENIDGEIMFNTETNIEGRVKLNIPRYSAPLIAAFDFNGISTGFQSHVEYSFDNSKSDADVSFAINPLRIVMNVRTPLKTFVGNVAFDGSLTNFKTQSVFTIDNRKVDIEAHLNIETAFEGSANVIISGLKPYRASFEHSLQPGKSRSVFSVEQDGNVFVGFKMNVSKSPLAATLSIQTPFEGYNTMSLIFKHDGEMTNFNNHAEISIGDQRTQGDMTFNFGSKLEGRISASSPYFATFSTGFEFSGSFDKFASLGNISYGENKYSFSSSVDTTAGIDISATANTPIEGFRTLTAKLTHKGHVSNFDSFAQVKTGRRNLLTGSVRVDNTTGLNAKMTFQSVFTPTVQVSLEHTGDIANFNTKAELRYNGQTSSVIVGFKTVPSISGLFALTSPYTSPISGAFNVDSDNDKTTVHAEGKFNTDTIAGDVSYHYGQTVGATISVTTPFEGYEKIRGAAQYVSYFKGFSAVANAEYQGKKIESEVRGSWGDEITGSLTINTPFQMLQHSRADFTFARTFPNIKSQLNFVYNSEKYSLNANVQDLNGKITVTTPISGLEDLSVVISNNGNIKNLRSNVRITYMTGREIFASIENKLLSDRLETKATFSSPYTEDITFDLTFIGKSSDFSNTVSFAMGNENSAISSTTFKLGTALLELDSSLQTVLAGYADEQKLAILYDGIFPNIKASATAKVLGSYFSSEASLQVDDQITGMFNLRTPINNLNDVTLNFEHNGDMRRFSTKAELQYDTGKKIEGSVQYAKYGWRRLQTTVEIRTPFTGFEISKASYRHTASVDSLECDADLSFMNKDFNGNLRAALSPLSASLSLSTPYTGFEQLSADARLAYGTGFFNAESNVQYMQGKTITLSSKMEMTSSPKTASLKLTTPFQGYEISEISVTNSGDFYNFQSSVSLSTSALPSIRSQTNWRYLSLQNFEGSMTFESQIPNMEQLRLNVKNEGIRGKYNSKVQVSWAPARSIVMQGSVTDNRYSVTSDITLTTPFESVKHLNSKTETGMRGSMYTHKSVLQYNGKTVSDFEGSIDLAEKKAASMLMRAPVTGRLNVEGSLTGKYEGVLSMSQDISDLNKGLKVSGVYDPESKGLSLKYDCPVKTVAFDGILSTTNPKFDLYVDSSRYGYDMTIASNSGKVKVTLPSRSIVVSGSCQNGISEGSLMWDADRDLNKKIGFRAALTPSRESTKADITILMPSFGKEVQIDSQMSVNSGRILFDGKTELTYSKDSRKKFTIMSRFEDISNDLSSKNYSFIFGISHPYTSVDVQVASQFGKSDQKLTGGVNMKYVTITRETKTFSANGQIDKVKKSFSFGMETPLKKIGIDGNAQTESPYRLALANKYDDKRPLNTILSFDPSKRSVEFQMNYDLENPANEFHLSAKYVNSSAIATEMFHVVNRQRVTDALMVLRLNSSHLLHSRLHWRPDMMADLKAFADRKMTGYNRQLRNLAEIAFTSIQTELSGKAQLIDRSVAEEIKPALDKLRNMYNTNEYYVRDVTDAVVAALEEARLKLGEMSEMTEEYISDLSSRLEDKLSNCLESQRENIADMISRLEEAREHIVLKTSALYNKYASHAYNMSRPVLMSANDRYNKYVQYMNQLSSTHVANTADLANTAIYGARDYINFGLASLMARDDVKYAKSVSNTIYQHGYNSYKAWEIRENTETVARTVANWIREEIEKEMSDLKATILNILKSEVTVYDPQNGEIQMEFHLPIPLKSLDAIPAVDFTLYITKAKKYVPTLPSISLPSSDVTTWLPPYDATAMIVGYKVTTFDGVSYDLDNSCTFILARDFVDFNFSLILHKEDNNKTLIISAQGQSVKIFADGKVTVNDVLVELPTIVKGISVTSLDGHVIVNVAGHVTVDYEKDLDSYVISVNGYYYGKIGGILGAYDNEPANDMMTSFGKPADNPDRFLRTWEISSERCR